jgi:asparagine synthase (glutamine-hydrolysing)
MAGIAGIAAKNSTEKVTEMLGRIRYRGRAGISVFEKDGTTLGMVWNEPEKERAEKSIASGAVGDDNGKGHCASVRPEHGKLILYRDELGVAPLYYGMDSDGNICFASEIKALLSNTREIHEIPPGYFFDGDELKSYFRLKAGVSQEETPEQLARRLYKLLDNVVKRSIRSENIGSWLSGGLDSSTISALASGHVRKLKTFSAGLKGAPDIEFARGMAEFIKSDHHEVIVSVDDLIRILPEVIYHLESFDALLVRSSITNYIVAKVASEHVSEVFSGEGGDELFAGYEYLKSIPGIQLESELLKITGSLHNTALQRVDRCASAHGTIAHVIFTNPDVVNFALRIPVKYKIYNNIEKWILRKAMEEYLPESILNRPKEKFWEGAGTKGLISSFADKQITDHDFKRERRISDSILINTKEELYYYRIFKDHFGSDVDLSWMGRTQGSPVA